MSLEQLARKVTTALRHDLEVQGGTVSHCPKGGGKRKVEHPPHGHSFVGKAMISLQNLSRSLNHRQHSVEVVLAFLQSDTNFTNRCRVEIDSDQVAWVGARYGHSFGAYRHRWFADLDKLYERVTVHVDIGHVTTLDAAPLIADSGLKRRGRDTVHALPLVGNRPSHKGYEGKFKHHKFRKVVVLDVVKMLEKGIPIYRSVEGGTDIFLIPQDIAPEYILRIVDKP
jgi:RNA:NAD 2'-phosphotransferase (TPT1/KptA family)